MAFDPDLYIETQIAKGNKSAEKMGFDPDAYLAAKSPRGNIINSDVPTVAGEVPNPPMAREKERTIGDYAKAAYEIPATVGSSLLSQPIGAAYGVYKSMTSPEYGTQEGVRQGQRAGGELAQSLQFQPSSPVTADALGAVGDAIGASKMEGLGPLVIGRLPSAAQQLRGAGQVVKPIAQAAVQKIDDVVKPAVSRLSQALRTEEPSMAGVGAATVGDDVVRAQMAKQLRVPIDLSKGQQTRNLADQQFEAETMKTYPEDVGKPLIVAQELRNQKIGQNLDAYYDATGAKVANEFYLRPTGEVVDSELRNIADKSRRSYKNAYEIARASEEGDSIVDVTPIKNQLATMEAEALNAPVINSAKLKLEQLAPKGEITLNKLEEVRKMVRALSQDTPTQQKFGGDIARMIDTATENAGGDLFKEARRLRTKFANEFENIGLINDLLTTKGKSNDRVVALEKVFDRAVIQSDLDSLKSLGVTLKKTPGGQQAWREIQGQTIEHLRDAITKNIQTDSLGQRTFNPKQFDTIVRTLDKSGKLDYLFGKSGAQEIRNLRDTTMNVNSPVVGLNNSNTSSAMNKVLNNILKKAVGKVPFGGQLIEAGAEALEKKKIAEKVSESLNTQPKNIAKQLRQGK